MDIVVLQTPVVRAPVVNAGLQQCTAVQKQLTALQSEQFDLAVEFGGRVRQLIAVQATAQGILRDIRCQELARCGSAAQGTIH